MGKKTYSVVKIIDHHSPLWRNNREHNNCAIRCALECCYSLLKSQGYLFLNQVYQKLGLALTKEGQTSGWVYNKIRKKDYLWTIWHENNNEIDVHITFEPLENILDMLPSEEEL